MKYCPGIERLESRRLLSIDFPDFRDSDGLNLVGDASISAQGELLLTKDERSQIGGAWFSAQKQLVALGFETRFEFRMTNGSHGLAFAIQNHSASSLKASAANLGYNGLPNSLVVEFDVAADRYGRETASNHVSIHTGGRGFNFTTERDSLVDAADTRRHGVRLNDGRIHHARIHYVPGELSVFLDDVPEPVVEVEIDLAEILELDAGRAWVGFTAATHIRDMQTHEIVNWSFSSTGSSSPAVFVADASVAEGDAGRAQITFVAKRVGSASNAASFQWTTEDESAEAGRDYLPMSGQVVFDRGQTEKTIAVDVVGDIDEEASESLLVRFSDADGVTLADSFARGTILNDDAQVTVSSAVGAEGH